MAHCAQPIRVISQPTKDTIAHVVDTGNFINVRAGCKVNGQTIKSRRTLFPYFETQKTILVFGKRNAGKSLWIRNYVMMKQLYQQKMVYVIGNKPIHGTFETKKVDEKKLLPNDNQSEFVKGALVYNAIVVDSENYIDFTWENYRHMFRNSVVVFDDCQYDDPKVEKAVRNLSMLAIDLGRENGDSKDGNGGTEVIISTHAIRNAQIAGLRSRMDAYVFFQHNLPRATLIDFLRKEGYSMEIIMHFLNSQQLWMFLNTVYPKFVMNKHEIKML